MHRTTRRFWDCFHELPAAVQSVAEDNFDLLKRNPRHPSLYFKILNCTISGNQTDGNRGGIACRGPSGMVNSITVNPSAGDSKPMNAYEKTEVSGLIKARQKRNPYGKGQIPDDTGHPHVEQ